MGCCSSDLVEETGELEVDDISDPRFRRKPQDAPPPPSSSTSQQRPHATPSKYTDGVEQVTGADNDDDAVEEERSRKPSRRRLAEEEDTLPGSTLNFSADVLKKRIGKSHLVSTTSHSTRISMSGDESHSAASHAFGFPSSGSAWRSTQ